MHIPLSQAVSVTIVPFFSLKRFLSLISKHKPNHLFSVPAHWRVIYNKENASLDLSSLKNVVVAGDITLPKFEKDINNYLHNHGAGCVSITQGINSKSYVLGFSGQIVPHHRVKIVDDEICVRSDGCSPGYYQNPEASDGLIRKHKDGFSWLQMGK